MNKKTLLATMSLAVLAACSTDDFQSQTNVAEETSPVQFELINGNNDVTRASWSETYKAVSFSAADGDLFTLYHGGTWAGVGNPLSNFENATYKAAGSPATLSTPSMIKQGNAVMVWPVDTAFNIGSAADFSISIPVAQTDYVNQVPYVSDLIGIGAYGPYNEDPTEGPVTAWNTAGKDRKYPVFMRQMGSLLTLKTDYDGTDAAIKALATGDDPITPIKVTEIKLQTLAGGATEFTQKIPVTFGAANVAWATEAPANNNWVGVTEFDPASIATSGATTPILSAKENSLLEGNQGAKIIMLPQPTIDDTTPTTIDPTGVVDAAVTVNTIYGKVIIAKAGVAGTKYVDGEWEDAWIRYLLPATREEAYELKDGTAETSGDNIGRHKTTSAVAHGLMQTINWFSDLTNRTSSNAIVEGEQVGGLLTRYVKVLLTHLDMSDLHIKNDKQLRDAARVWEAMGLDPVTVYLDGDDNGEFAISQKTIKVINDINDAASALAFKVKPCKTAGEACQTIVITGGGDVPNIPFIVQNGTTRADVALNAGETWNWKGTIKVAEVLPATTPATAHISSIINRGTMVNAETATLNVENNAGTKLINVPFVNAEGAEWNITAGTLRVQFDVTNYSTVTISKGAQYRQDATDGVSIASSKFTNERNDVPTRFGGDDDAVGTVWNYGVFATIGGGEIDNFGLIEHADIDAKTYITRNQTTIAGGYATNADFTAPFDATLGSENKIGRINLPITNKDEDNVSISAAAPGMQQGFVSVTINGETVPTTVINNGALNLTSVGNYVNYLIVKAGVTSINAAVGKVKYLEVNMTNKKELAWNVSTTATNLDGLMVLSDLNIKLGTTVTSAVTYLGADMYVGGTFNAGTTDWYGYYGDTSGNVPTKYITF